MRMRIVVYAPSETQAVRACQLAFAKVEAIEQIASDYRPDSELMTLCREAVGRQVPVSATLGVLLERSLRLSRETDGAFDITAGPAVKLWREARRTQTMPSTAQLRDALNRMGWQKIRWRKRDRTLELAVQGMELDLGGIAKGYACSEALKVLKRNRLSIAMVEMGGDLVFGGAPPNANGWSVRITHAQPAKLAHQSSLYLSEAALSTSGDTEQFVEINGKRYSHIVDPRTGIGLTNRTMATVLAPDGITADSLATAACVLGAPKAYALMRQYANTQIWLSQAG